MFETLTAEQKEMLLKTVLLFAVKSNDEVSFSKDFIKYGAEAFDYLVKTELTDETIILTKKGKK